MAQEHTPHLFAAEEGEAAERRDHAERLTLLASRVRGKIDDYSDYRFNLQESQALNIFFDLAQEYPNIHDLLTLCVIIPQHFFNRRADLYLFNSEGLLEWRSNSQTGCAPAHRRDGAPQDGTPLDDQNPPLSPVLYHEPTLADGRFYFPIKGNQELLTQLSMAHESGVMGLLAVGSPDGLTPHERLFFEKYANRIGFQLHNRLISTKNREHLLFIRALVDDIGHNVIVPNMYFKLFYRRLESKITVLREISTQFAEYSGHCRLGDLGKMEQCARLQRELNYTHDALMEQFREIYRHYEQTSLFLETLLRRGHFEKGHYVLERQSVNLKRQVVDPQVERYRGRLAERGIAIVPAGPAMLDDQLEIEADVGLLSQVFANLFSNAVKYTREVRDAAGNPQKFMRYGCRLVDGSFAWGARAVRCEVYTSGPTLGLEEVQRLYTEGFRGANVAGEYGTGHGLHFVREVVGLHGGVVGYESGELGNVFFFLLPLTQFEKALPATAQAS